MAAICRSTIIKESTPLKSEWALRSLRNDHAVYVGMGTPLISEWLRRSAGICTDEDGFFQVCYNYFENDCWEDAGMYRGHVYSGKVGWRQFCRVMAAARILEERSSDALCFADLRDADIPHFFPLGWLKYLFGEELPLDSPSLWDTYLFLKDAGRYDGSEDSWNQILIRNAGSFPDWMDILAIRTAEHGTEAAYFDPTV